MNQPNSQGSQIFRFLLLGLAGFFLWNSFNQQQNQKPAVPPRAPLKLVEAFNNIAPSQGAPLDKTTALAEVERLDKLVAANPKDEVAMWAHLRTGLIQQYILGDLKPATRKGFLGFGATTTYYPAYDAIVTNAAGDAIEAQALYQTGDLQWRQSVKKDGKASPEAVAALQTLVTKARGNSEFLATQIYVPKSEFGNEPADPQLIPIVGIPQYGFAKVKIGDLHGNAANPLSAGIIDRVDASFHDSTYFKIFDMMVKILGNNPVFSYGLAILIFAIFTRSVMQPIYKKQYDSMKGMAVIAPQMKKIQAKYKENKDPSAQMQMMKEIKAAQAAAGVNPMMGCAIGLLQMPIFFFIVYPMIQHYEPHMELVGASFGWIHSLARPDIPLLVLYGLAMFFSFRLSSTPPTDDMQKQQQMIMSFVMPIMFPFFLIAYPSAFTLYWTIYSLISALFQWKMIKAVDPHKNLWRQLTGADLLATNPDADAVPARPAKDDKPILRKVEKPALQTGKSSLDLDKIAGSNGHLNGGATNGNGTNGAHHAAPEGSVLKPQTSETKRGGRRGKKKR